MARLFIAGSPVFGYESVETKDVAKIQAHLSHANYSATKVECILAPSGRIDQIRILCDEALEMEKSEEESASLEKREIKQVFSLKDFKEKVTHLGESESLNLDADIAQILQRVFEISPKQSNLVVEKEVTSNLEALKKQSPEQVLDLVVLTDKLLESLDCLPLENALRIFEKLAEGNDPEKIYREIQVFMIRSIMQGAFLKPENQDFLNSPQGFFDHSSYLDWAFHPNFFDLLFPYLSSRTLEYLLAHCVHPGFFQHFLEINESRESIEVIAEQFAENALRTGNFRQYKTILRRYTSKTPERTSQIVNQLQVLFNSSYYRLLRKKEEPLTSKEIISLLQVNVQITDSETGLPIDEENKKLVQEYNRRIVKELKNADPRALVAELTSKEDRTAFLTSLIYTFSPLKINQLKFVVPIFVHLGAPLLKDSHYETYSFLFPMSRPKIWMHTFLDTLLNLDCSPSEVLPILELLTPSKNAVGDTFFREIAQFFKELKPKNKLQLYALSDFVNRFGETEGPSQVGIDNFDVSHLTDEILKMPPYLLEVWFENIPFQKKVLQQSYEVTPLLRTRIPTYPLGSIEILGDKAWLAQLKENEIPQRVIDNLQTIWDKTVHPSEVHLKRVMQRTFSKVLELAKEKLIDQVSLRHFFSNVQLESRACWPGLIQKMQKEFRALTLHLVKDEIPKELLPPYHAAQLQAKIEPLIDGASEEEYDLKSAQLIPFQAAINAVAEGITKTQSDEEKKAAIAQLSQVIQRRFNEDAKGSIRHLSTEAKIAFATTHFNGNKRLVTFLELLIENKGNTKLTLAQSLQGLRLPGFMSRQVFMGFIRPLTQIGLVEEKEGLFSVNKEHSLLKALQEELSKQDSEREAKAQDATPALLFALQKAVQETPQMLEAQQKDAFHALQTDCVLGAKLFFEQWIDGKSSEIRFSLGEKFLTQAAHEELRREEFPDLERKLAYIQKHAEKFVADQESYQDLLASIGIGNETHVLAAAKDVFADPLGLPPNSAELDEVAQSFKGLLEHTDLAWDVEMWKEEPFFDQKLALCHYMADLFNSGAAKPTDSIEHEALLVPMIRARIEKEGGAYQKELLEQAFKTTEPPSDSETGVGRIRITPLGASFALKELNLLKTI